MTYCLKLAVAIKNLACAEASLRETLRHFYPVGAMIRWEYNGAQYGEVVMHGYQEKIRVRNKRTGAEYWITAHHITA